MRTKTWTVESGLYGVALLLAFAIRLIHLGENPLSDAEADLALRALALGRGERVAIGAQAGYVLWTGSLFYFFEVTNFLARLLPALAGSLLIGVPWLLRGRIGKNVALLLAFFLAIDPGLVAAARQADSVTLAAAFLLLALAFWMRRQAALTGVFAGLALLSGPQLWPGVLSLAVAWGGSVLLMQRHNRTEAQEGEILPARDWKNSLAWLVGSFFILGTMFFVVPGGLGGAVGSLPAWLQGWSGPARTTISQMLAALVVYEVVAWAFGFAGGVAQIKHAGKLDRFLGFWAAAALLLALIYPARQELHLVWVILPLLGLAARVVEHLLNREVEMRWVAWVLAAAMTALWILAWNNLGGAVNPAFAGIEGGLRWVRLAASLAVIAIAVLLVGWGWSVSAARAGFVWGLMAVVSIYAVSASWHAAGLGPHPEAELWRSAPYAADADLLMKTIGDQSAQQTGERTGLDVMVLRIASPALEWLLRDQKEVRFVDFLAGEEQPSLVITADQEALGLTASYSGQDFVWQRTPAWSLLLQSEWLKWVTFREVLTQEERIILWVRTDLFPLHEEVP